MIEAVQFWNEPNNRVFWDADLDPEWADFARMSALAARTVRERAPGLRLVLGGVSPVDPDFLALLRRRGLLDTLDAVALHGYPLDWSLWPLDAWPQRIAEAQAAAGLPVWITETGASTFGADEAQAIGLRRTQELLLGRVERAFWSSLLDLPAAWSPTTGHNEGQGSYYYRHFYLGLVRADGTPKPALDHYDPEMGVSQWFSFEDPRLEGAVAWLHRLGVRRVRTAISWADWRRPEAATRWFDRQMAALRPFDTTVTLCFTPPSRGKREHPASPPQVVEEFAGFAAEVVERYVLSALMIIADQVE